MTITDLSPVFRPGACNAWILLLPLLLPGIYLGGFRKDVARRLADMTGYRVDEKVFTVAASVAPYPFIVLTVWTPFTRVVPLVAPGLGFYLAGMVGFISALRAFARTPPGELCSTGPYRWSRNPLYVTAALVFLGVSLATANVVLFGLLLGMLLLQHRMILAEERACRQKHGARYLQYAERVPRYVARMP
jgi:protein-S-isoprenylcysteine O-methyltransferase Ste14